MTKATTHRKPVRSIATLTVIQYEDGSISTEVHNDDIDGVTLMGVFQLEINNLTEALGFNQKYTPLEMVGVRAMAAKGIGDRMQKMPKKGASRPKKVAKTK